jgi:hypothetical protein
MPVALARTIDEHARALAGLWFAQERGAACIALAGSLLKKGLFLQAASDMCLNAAKEMQII